MSAGSAGNLIWIPSAQQFAVSADVAFDEYCSSTLAYDGRLYHNSLPICTTTDAPHDSLSPLAWTGPPVVSADPANPDDPWTPTTAYEELFAIRKACKHMHLPGRLHF